MYVTSVRKVILKAKSNTTLYMQCSVIPVLINLSTNFEEKNAWIPCVELWLITVPVMITPSLSLKMFIYY